MVIMIINIVQLYMYDVVVDVVAVLVDLHVKLFEAVESHRHAMRSHPEMSASNVASGI